jgi:hypothetical protein
MTRWVKEGRITRPDKTRPFKIYGTTRGGDRWMVAEMPTQEAAMLTLDLLREERRDLTNLRVEEQTVE